MKLFYLANSIVPSRTANSVHVMKMCNALSKSELLDDVELCIPKCKQSDENVFEYYGVNESFTISRQKKGERRFSWYVFSVRQVLHVILKSNNKNDSLVYGRNFLSCILLAILNYKVIYECHSPISRYNFLVRVLFKFFSNKFIKTVVISEKLKEIISVETSKSPVKFKVLHDAADPTPLSLHKMKITDVFKVGYIGHLYKGRGVELILKVAEKLPHIQFHFFGGEERDIERLSKEISDNVIFHGYVDPNKVPIFRSKMNVLVAPYQTNTSIQGLVNTAEYMSPLKIFEYMSSNRPLICSDLPVLREVLENNVNCLLVNPDEDSAWINAIKALEVDPALSVELSNRALSDFELNYSWDIRAKKVMEIYNENT